MYHTVIKASRDNQFPDFKNRAFLGKVTKQIDTNQWLINVGSEQVSVTVPEGELSIGDKVFITTRGETVFIQKTDLSKQPTATETEDHFDLGPVDFLKLLSSTKKILLRSSAANNFADLEKQLSILQNAAFFCNKEEKLAISEIADQLSRVIASDPSETTEAIATANDTLDRLLNEQLRTKTDGESVLLSGHSSKNGVYNFASIPEAANFFGIHDPKQLLLLQNLLGPSNSASFMVQANGALSQITPFLAANFSSIINQFQEISEKQYSFSTMQDLQKVVAQLPFTSSTMIKSAASLLESLSGSGITLFNEPSFRISTVAQWLSTAEQLPNHEYMAAHTPDQTPSLVGSLLEHHQNDLSTELHLSTAPGITLEKVSETPSDQLIKRVVKELGITSEHDLFNEIQGSSFKTALVNVLSKSRFSEWADQLSKVFVPLQKSLSDLKEQLNLLSGTITNIGKNGYDQTTKLALLSDKIDKLLHEFREQPDFGNAKKIVSELTSLKLAVSTLNEFGTELPLKEYASFLTSFESAEKNLSTFKTFTDTNKQLDLLPKNDASLEVLKESTSLLPTSKTLFQNLEKVLTRIETMQLLSSKVQSPDGETQLLSLPIKIGTEWTEVYIRFSKKRSSQQEAKKNRFFSVQIDIAPSTLGEISARLDYISKQNLKVTMQFEKPHSSSWFKENEISFKDALEKIGFLAPTIIYHLKSQATNSDLNTHRFSEQSENRFDVKI